MLTRLQASTLWDRGYSDAEAKRREAERRAAADAAEREEWLRFAKRHIERSCDVGPFDMKLIAEKRLSLQGEGMPYLANPDGDIRRVTFAVLLPGCDTEVLIDFMMFIRGHTYRWLYAAPIKMRYRIHDDEYPTLRAAVYAANPSGYFDAAA